LWRPSLGLKQAPAIITETRLFEAFSGQETKAPTGKTLFIDRW
jgi:hypothetical protein